MKNSGKTASGESGSCFVEWMAWVVEEMERNVTEGTDELSHYANVTVRAVPQSHSHLGSVRL